MKKLFSLFAFLIVLSVFADSYKIIVRHANGKGYFLATDSIDSIYYSTESLPEGNIYRIGMRDTVADTLVIRDTLIVRDTLTVRDTITKYVYTGVISTDSWNVDVENPVVADYMNEVDYADYLDDTTYTKINDYCSIPTDYRKDEPRGRRLEWDIPGNGQAVILSCRCDSCVKTDTIKVADGIAYADVYNLIPGKRYDYTICSDSVTVKKSHFFAQGQSRMMYLPSLHNVRDLGGWRTEDGRRIKYGRIFRGGELNDYYGIHYKSCPDSTHQISSEDSLFMHDNMDIRLEIDLRDNRDMNISNTDTAMWRNHTELGADVTYKNEMVNYDPAAFKKTGYYYMQRWGRCLKYIVQTLKEGHNVYFHCVWGGDRSGTLAMLIEGLLGVPEEDLAKDFELTAMVYGGRDRTISYWRQNLAYIKSLSGETLKDKFASYFIMAKVTQGEIDTFRQIMTE